jgi:hypothetical protein
MRRASRDVLTVEQTAQVLGIGRQTAYTQCRLFLASDRSEGIPCHRIGRLILIYRAELETWLGFEIVWPPQGDDPKPALPQPHSATPPPGPKRPSPQRRVRRATVDQATLPF